MYSNALSEMDTILCSLLFFSSLSVARCVAAAASPTSNLFCHPQVVGGWVGWECLSSPAAALIEGEAAFDWEGAVNCTGQLTSFFGTNDLVEEYQWSLDGC